MNEMKRLAAAALAALMLLPLLAVNASAASYYVTFPSDGDYYIVCSNGGYALDVTGGGDAPACTPIQLYEINHTDAQIWTLRRVDGDWYQIIHKRTGMVLNVQNGDARPDGRLWLYPEDGTEACRWRFAAAGSEFILQNQTGGQYVLDLHNNESYNCALVHLWNLHDGPSARWKLVPVSSGGSSSNSGGGSCFPRYTGSSGSIADALRSMGIDSSYAYRKRIAEANGISGYSGSASQNTALLNALKAGTLRNPDGGSSGGSSSSNNGGSYFPRYTGRSGSIADALRSMGIDSSYANRKRIAEANGIYGYSGSASQNTALLNALKAGTLRNPDGGGAPAPAPAPSAPSGGGSVEYHASSNVSVSDKAQANRPQYTNTAGQRGADALNTVIDQFQVTSNQRYQKNSNGTYCNIFAWDVTSALDCELPHWTLNNVIAAPYTRGAKEMRANDVYEWLRNHGGSYGWRSVSAWEAQQRANSGFPTVAIWKNTGSKPGHVAVVRPEGNGYSYSDARGPVIAQAGASNYSYTNVSTGFGSSRMSAVVYWTHD